MLLFKATLCSLLVAWLLLPCAALSAPSISSVSDSTPTDGQTITISGSGFGSHSDYNGNKSYLAAAWEDCETLSGGYLDSTGTIWRTSDSRSQLNTSNTRTGSSRHLRHGDNISGTTNRPFGGTTTSSDKFALRADLSSSYNKLYLSMWISPESQFYMDSSSATDQAKILGFKSTDNVRSYTAIDGGPNSTPPDTWHINIMLEDGYLGDRSDYSYGLSEGHWHKHDMYFDFSAGTWKSWIDGRLVFTKSHNSYTLDQCGFIQYMRNFDYEDMWLLTDDHYISYTLARVFISDQSSYSEATTSHQEIQIPLSWTTTSIEIEVNQGSFTDSDTAYVYVVDSNGNVSNGEIISFSGEDPPDETNPVVTIDVPTTNSTYDNGTDDDVYICASITDNVAVSSASYSNSAVGGGSGSLTFTSGDDWCGTIALVEEENPITITGYDTSSNSSTDLITVTYTPVVLIDAPSIGSHFGGDFE